MKLIKKLLKVKLEKYVAGGYLPGLERALTRQKSARSETLQLPLTYLRYHSHEKRKNTCLLIFYDLQNGVKNIKIWSFWKKKRKISATFSVIKTGEKRAETYGHVPERERCVDLGSRGMWPSRSRRQTVDEPTGSNWTPEDDDEDLLFSLFCHHTMTAVYLYLSGLSNQQPQPKTFAKKKNLNFENFWSFFVQKKVQKMWKKNLNFENFGNFFVQKKVQKMWKKNLNFENFWKFSKFFCGKKSAADEVDASGASVYRLLKVLRSDNNSFIYRRRFPTTWRLPMSLLILIPTPIITFFLKTKND